MVSLSLFAIIDSKRHAPCLFQKKWIVWTPLNVWIDWTAAPVAVESTILLDRSPFLLPFPEHMDQCPKIEECQKGDGELQKYFIAKCSRSPIIFCVILKMVSQSIQKGPSIKTAHLNYVHATHNHTSLFRCTSSGMNVIGSRFELLALTAHLQEGTGAHFFRIGAKTASINRKIKFIWSELLYTLSKRAAHTS